MKENLPGKRNPLWYSEKIYQLRISLGLSQAAFGKKIGVSGASIGQLERGESKSPSADLLAAMASILSVNLHWLLNGEGEMLKPVPDQDTGINNSAVSGAPKRIPIDPRILTGDTSQGEQPGFSYPPAEASPKEVVGNLVEQIVRNAGDIEKLKAAILKIQEQLKD